MKILAVIPARGGSKGIPRKNLRLLNGKPLIFYSINNALKCELIDDVVVTSDSDEIIYIAESYGVDTVCRAQNLCDDRTTLDPVVCDAVVKMEKLKKYNYDIVVTLQPTSPLLSVETLNDALENFINSDFDTYISVTNSPHLSWTRERDNGFKPMYQKRLIRQALPPCYLETGAFLITKRNFVSNSNRIGDKVNVYEVPKFESVDIDEYDDWIICENRMKKKKIVFRVDGYKELGMGHIYHCISLAYQMIGHELCFVTQKVHTSGLEKIKDTNFPYATIDNDNEFFEFLKKYRPDIVVNDCLDTEKDYILKLKEISKRVVTIEDLGPGASFADAVVNALYDGDKSNENVYIGYEYICLRDEFMFETPIEIKKEVENVLVLFGGTDPSNLTEKIYHLALDETKHNKRLKFTFLSPISYDFRAHNLVSCENIEILNHSARVSSYMKKADLAFTSQGRTVYELACMGVPSIVLAQNEREQLHKFAQMENGFLNLGLGSLIRYEVIKEAFDLLVNSLDLRQNMNKLMTQYDLKSGIQRVKNIILGD